MRRRRFIGLLLGLCWMSGCFGGYEKTEATAGEGAGAGPTTTAGPQGGDGAGAGGCMPLAQLFSQEMWPLMSTTCVNCHVSGGVAGSTMFILQPGNQAACLQATESIAKSTGPDGTSLLLLKPTNRISHGGGQPLDPNSPTYAAFAQFVARVNGQDPNCP